MVGQLQRNDQYFPNDEINNMELCSDIISGHSFGMSPRKQLSTKMQYKDTK